MTRLWILRLVPGFVCGRLVSAAVAFCLIALILYIGGGFYDDSGQFIGYVPLFFCVILSYIIPVFHLITTRTEAAFDDLLPVLDLEGEQADRMRQSIGSKPWYWLLPNGAFAVALWLLQSWILFGGRGMIEAVSSGPGYMVQTLVAPLVVWLAMTCVVHALINNAILFRQLAKRVRVDVLDPRALTPFGHMAVSSMLAVVGAQASFSIMWLADTTSPWTTIPGMVPTTIALVFLFVAPIWPIHAAIKQSKARRVEDVQQRINDLLATDADNMAALAPLLAVRRELISTHEWPIDLGLLARLVLYLVIVPLTWIGAALIENVVDFFIAGSG